LGKGNILAVLKGHFTEKRCHAGKTCNLENNIGLTIPDLKCLGEEIFQILEYTQYTRYLVKNELLNTVLSPA
jgi:hypothetical protein